MLNFAPVFEKKHKKLKTDKFYISFTVLIIKRK